MRRFLLFVFFAAGSLLAAKAANPGNALKIRGKYNPGHYIYVYDDIPLTEIKGHDLPGVRGIIHRYFWKQIEPRKGEYDFSAIEKHLEECREHGKQLIVFIIDKSFTKNRSSCPDYFNPIMMHTDQGMMPHRWSDFYIERLQALTDALGATFDRHPNFEGINLQETSLAVDEKTLRAISQHPYTEKKYLKAIKRYVINTQKSLPNSRVFWFQNFLASGGNVPHTMPQAFVPYKIVMGGPDVLPARRAHVKSVYPKYELYKGKLPLCCSMQPPSYHTNRYDYNNRMPHNHRTDCGFTPMEELFLFARDTLHCNYIFWTYAYVDGPEPNGGSNTFNDALEVIAKHPVFNR